MKVSVLYGANTSTTFTEETRYVSERLGIRLSEKWDGFADATIPDTDEDVREELISFLGPDNVNFSAEERYRHSLGKSSPELLMAKHGKIQKIVDAVVYPTFENAAEIISNLAEKRYGAIIFGGGTSVSGSLLVGDTKKVVSLDTQRLKKIRLGKNYAILGAGMTGIEAEREVNRYGYTLGNFPESLHHSTLGGWVATKAIGQESNQYGGVERLLLAANLITSAGELRDNIVPRESSGLGVKDIALGSDGRYGLITEVVMRLFRVPAKRYFSSRFFRSFEEGIAALSKSSRFPSVARLSDELETEFALNNAGNSIPLKLYRKYLNVTGYGHGSLLIMVSNDVVSYPVISGSISGGSIPAQKWYKTRYSRPEIANSLWKGGLVPDTLETSATWDRIFRLYTETRNNFYALRDSKEFKGEIMAHISHLYREGACIYFTYIIQHEDEMEILDTVRDTLIRTFIRNGGSLTHHHGYGKFFSAYVNTDIRRMQEKMADPLFGRRN